MYPLIDRLEHAGYREVVFELDSDTLVGESLEDREDKLQEMSNLNMCQAAGWLNRLTIVIQGGRCLGKPR